MVGVYQCWEGIGILDIGGFGVKIGSLCLISTSSRSSPILLVFNPELAKIAQRQVQWGAVSSIHFILAL